VVVLAAVMLVCTPMLAFGGGLERRNAGLVSLRALLRSPLLDVQDRALVSSLTRHAARGSMEP